MTRTQAPILLSPQYRILVRDHGSHEHFAYAGADLTLHIGAPAPWGPDEDGGMHLFLDPHNSPLRSEHGNAWQLFCDTDCGGEAFHRWAQDFAQLLMKALLEKGLCCVDLADLRTLLHQGRGKRIIGWQGDWQDTDQLPQWLQSVTAEHAWVAVFAPPQQLSMQLYAMAGARLEERLSEDAMLMVTGNLLDQAVPKMMMVVVKTGGP